MSRAGAGELVHSQHTVTERDLRRLLAIVEQARECPDDWVLPPVVLAGLRELVPCTDISFTMLDTHARCTVGGVYLEGGATLHDLAVPSDDPAEDELDAVFWDAWATESGCGCTQLTGDWTTVLRQSDRMPDRVLAGTAVGDCMRIHGVRHEVLVALPPLGHVERRLLLFRHDGLDFTDREVLLLKVFRPHLLELHDQQRRRQRRRPELTARQWEVMREVAAGASNAQVGEGGP